jgi:ribosomal protein L7/L12
MDRSEPLPARLERPATFVLGLVGLAAVGPGGLVDGSRWWHWLYLVVGVGCLARAGLPPYAASPASDARVVVHDAGPAGRAGLLALFPDRPEVRERGTGEGWTLARCLSRAEAQRVLLLLRLRGARAREAPDDAVRPVRFVVAAGCVVAAGAYTGVVARADAGTTGGVVVHAVAAVLLAAVIVGLQQLTARAVRTHRWLPVITDDALDEARRWARRHRVPLYSVDLSAPASGRRPVAVVREVRGLVGLGLADANALVAAGGRVLDSVSKAEAGTARTRLEAAGARVVVVPETPGG